MYKNALAHSRHYHQSPPCAGIPFPLPFPLSPSSPSFSSLHPHPHTFCRAPSSPQVISKQSHCDGESLWYNEHVPCWVWWTSASPAVSNFSFWSTRWHHGVTLEMGVGLGGREWAWGWGTGARWGWGLTVRLDAIWVRVGTGRVMWLCERKIVCVCAIITVLIRMGLPTYLSLVNKSADLM